MKREYINANQAYLSTLNYIKKYGVEFDNTLAIFNHGFFILNPLDNIITNKNRKWSLNYAIKEWEWYLSKNASIKEISKNAKIWLNHADSNFNVNSNYGTKIFNHKQYENIVNIINSKGETRKAWFTIYDGKEIINSPYTNNGYSKDTPCTLNIGFQYYNNKLNMSVYMRSNDIHYGFCNDQYCFTKLFEMICKETKLPMGTYYHHSANLHLYL